MLNKSTPYMIPRADGSCSALSKNSDGCSCSVYATRPTVCRQFNRGNPKCLEAVEFARFMGQLPQASG